MKSKIVFLLLFVMFCNSVLATDNAFDQIMQNIRQWEVYSPEDSIIQSYMDGMQADGSWVDINYIDQTSPWQSELHYNRLLPMAYAYISPENTYYNDTTLYDKIVLGINYWLLINPHSPNWYHNQINEPLLFGLVLIAMRDGAQTLPVGIETQIIQRWRNNGSNPANEAGSNRSEMALHWMYFACLTESPDTLNLALNYIFEPVVYTTGEGLQVDNSFLQHGPQLYIGGYGEVLLETVLQAAVCVAGTDYSLSGEKLNILRSFVLDSYSNVIRGAVINWNSIGRQLTRPDFLRYPTRRIPIFEKMKNIDGANAAIYTQILNRLKGIADPEVGVSPYHSHFFRGDYTIHVRPGYSFSTRMVSSRTCRQEILNGENLLGYFLSDGSTVITSSGNEYLDLMPLWDWNKIPGVTAPIVETIPVAPLMVAYGNTNFAGGVNDSLYGCTAYKYYDDYSGVNTGASKGYFFFNDEIVCLGAGVNSTHEVVQTTINQSWGKEQFVVGTDNGNTVLNGDVNQMLGNDIRWILHDGIGYYFPDMQHILVENKEKVGNWRWISTIWADSLITGKVFTLGIQHSYPVQDGKYSYMIIPNSTTTSLTSFSTNNNIEILANTDSVQVVYHNQLNLYECIFYRACLFKGEFEILSLQPCALMVQKQSDDYVAHIADPTQAKTKMIIGIKGNEMESMSYYAFDYTGIDNQYAGMTKSLLDTICSLIPSSVDVQIACEPFTWIDGITYTESTTDPIVFMTNAAGCDSIVNLHLTIFTADSTEFSDIACESYTWDNETYTESGDYTRTYTNVHGCDSIATLHLTIFNADSTEFTDSSCESYVWDGMTYTETGNYTRTYSNIHGCDSIATLHLTIFNTDNTEFTDSSCESYVWDGVAYTESGDYTRIYTNVNGCDSISTLHLTIYHTDSTEFSDTACESYIWNNITYIESGDYTRTYTTIHGCDSIAILHLTINYNVTEEFIIETTDSCYVWNGQPYCISGDYQQLFIAENGCDSIVTLHLSILMGIEEHDLNAQVYLIPNPVKQVTYVVGLNEQPKFVEVIDMHGRVLMRVKGEKLDVSFLSNGYYLVRIHTGDIIINRKLVKI